MKAKPKKSVARPSWLKPKHYKLWEKVVATGQQKFCENVSDLYAVLEGCYFDEEAANRPVQFIETLLCFAPGKKFILVEYQRKIVRAIFGWKRADGNRRFKSAYIWMPKKNGKSMLLGAIALYLMIGDGEWKSETFCAAFSRSQAKLVWGYAASIVKCSPLLKDYVETFDTTSTIVFRDRASKICAISREAEQSEGLNGNVIVDEIHAHKNRQLWDSLRFAGSARTNPLLVSISTSGDSQNHWSYDLFKQSQKILSGEWQDSSIYACVYAIEEGEDWRDPKVHARLNPALGLFMDKQQFTKDFQSAVQMKSSENNFKRYRLNAWIQTTTSTRAFDLQCYDACPPLFPLESYIGKECYVGIDLSNVSDLTAICLLFPHEDKTFSVLPYCFVPEDTAKSREDRGEAAYLTWSKQGHISLMPGNAIDQGILQEAYVALTKMYAIKQTGVDPWNAYQFMMNLGADGHNLTVVRQGYQTLNEATKFLQTLILTKRLRHGDHPVLRWCIECSATMSDNSGNIKLVKDSAKTEKIDAAAATVSAIAVGPILQAGTTSGFSAEEWEKFNKLLQQPVETPKEKPSGEVVELPVPVSAPVKGFDWEKLTQLVVGK